MIFFIELQVNDLIHEYAFIKLFDNTIVQQLHMFSNNILKEMLWIAHENTAVVFRKMRFRPDKV